MKKRVLVLMGVCFVIMLSSCKGNESDKYNMNKKLDIIELNHIATNAAENCIEKVEIDNDIKKEIKIVEEKQIELYSNNPKEYNEKELNVLLEDCFCDKIKSTDSDVDMDIYLLEKGGSLTYYKNSGGLSYSKTMDGDYDSSEKIVSDNKLIGIAQAFIEKSKLFDLNDLFLEYVRPSMYVEEDEIEKVERYEVRFQKKPPKGIDGYVGSQLGISVEIDCNGKIIGFLSFDREIEKINLLYPSKNIKEIEEDILNDKNVMLDYNSSVDKVEFTKMNYVLYCDSVLDKQKYIVPHYEMIDDKNNVVAVLPAIEDKYIKVK